MLQPEMVDTFSENPRVGGSNPPLGTIPLDGSADAQGGVVPAA